MTEPAIEVEHVPRVTPEARALIEELEAELATLYPPEQRHGLSVERVFQPNVVFFVARLDGAPVGCGGIAFADGYAEVKRMYVRPAARGKGVAQAVLDRLEATALARGFRRVALETGEVQLAAIRVYERAGYERCAAFGDYSTLPPHTIRRSVFFAKDLGS
jgi:putative acetyltransferase